METGTLTDGKGNTYPTIKLNDGNWWTKQNWRYEACDYYDCGCTGYHVTGADPSPSTLPTLGIYYQYDILTPTIPEGWRLPTQEEWTKLIQLYGNGDEGKAFNALVKGGSSGLDLEISGHCFRGGGSGCHSWGKSGTYWSSTKGRYDYLKIVLQLDKENNKIFAINDRSDDSCLNARLIKKTPPPKPHHGRGPARRDP